MSGENTLTKQKEQTKWEVFKDGRNESQFIKLDIYTYSKHLCTKETALKYIKQKSQHCEEKWTNPVGDFEHISLNT